MKKFFHSVLFSVAMMSMIACSGNSQKEGNNDLTNAENELVILEMIDESVPPVLEGEWYITAVNGITIPVITPKEEAPFLGFDMTEMAIYGNTGCNRLRGEVVLDTMDQLAIRFTQMASTRMMCHHDSLEQAVLIALNEVALYKQATCEYGNISPDCAKLLDAQNVELIRLVKKDSAPMLLDEK